MPVHKPFTLAVPALALTFVFATGALAQGTANQPAERERQEALENQSGQGVDASARDGHSSATNCADLLAEENRAADNAARDEVDRRSASGGQVSQSSPPAQGADGNASTASEGVTGNPQGSHDQLSRGNTTLTLEDCRDQQGTMPNGEPNGSEQ